MKKISVFIILLFFSILLISCSEKGTPEEETIAPTLSISNEDIALKVGESYTLTPNISEYQGEVHILFSSNNNAVATVDGGTIQGVGKGDALITIKIEEFPTVVKYVNVIVEENEEIPPVISPEDQALLKIEQVKSTLDVQIPSEITKDISLPKFLENYAIQLTWTSSLPKIIQTSGWVNRDTEDHQVTIYATISYKNFIGEYEKTVTVKKLTYPSLENKKLTFAYMFDGSYKPIREEDFQKIDVINYSFGWIVNGRLATYHLSNFTTVLHQAQQHGVRVVLAIGGWGGGGFSEACLTSETRAIFITSIIDTIKKYNLSGIDLDWEYPTSSAANIGSNPNDKANLTLFIKELKEAMNQLNTDLTLSIAVAAGVYASQAYYDVKQINSYLDYFHIMTYDLIDYSNLVTSHHTNLYSSQYGNSSADVAIKAYINAGADPKKIMLGIAFYGHIGTVTQQSENGIKVKSEGLTNSVTFTTISSKYLTDSNFIQYDDEVAKASWLFDGTTFITYDNPYSIENKCEYVNSNNLGGVMFWDLNGDTTGTLLNTIYINLNK